MQLVSHDLGFGHGSLIEDPDNGTVKYRASGKILPAFNIRLADVTGVSNQRKGFLKVLMRIHGQGTILAEIEVNHGTTELISNWFQSRNGLGSTRISPTGGVSVIGTHSISEELNKLAVLYKDGVLTEEEYIAAKRKVVGIG